MLQFLILHLLKAGCLSTGWKRGLGLQIITGFNQMEEDLDTSPEQDIFTRFRLQEYHTSLGKNNRDFPPRIKFTDS